MRERGCLINDYVIHDNVVGSLSPVIPALCIKHPSRRQACREVKFTSTQCFIISTDVTSNLATKLKSCRHVARLCIFY